MKAEIIDTTPAELINPCDQENFLPHTEINWPTEFDELVETYVQYSSEDMRDNLEIEISELEENCKMFAKEAVNCNEKFKRSYLRWHRHVNLF